MFSFQATDKATMSGVGIREGRATVADLLRAAGSGGAAPVANPSLLSSIHATNLAASALLASSLSVEEKAYVASRMGTLEPLRQQRSLDSILGQQRAALVKLAAGRRLIEQAKQSLNLEATMRAQITAPAILPAAARTPITPLQAQAPVLTTPNSPLAQLSPPLAQLNPPLAQPKQAPPKPKFEP
ncbi:expressed unknown protein [Seminavis robusta]|uniref:Uncharacterized protein n=1 Tax=Seminavis robusta TaxID=568900 RepID=A0A9N8HSP8_9STRA|nr:expressed unknown protein [Seminavis robusta]|eukprot:Sro1412_g270520.1 n/a (185) ;mRNA; r:28417-28971